MKIAVVGVGTGGIHSLCFLLGSLPMDTEVVSIHNPKINILGIGESTATSLPYALWIGAGFTMLDADGLDATTKHGVKYTNWNDESFYTHFLPPYYGMHFDNFKLGETVLTKLEEKWPTRFSQLTGVIDSITQTDSKVHISVDQTPYEFDYIIDCRGYPEDYTDYNVSSSIPVNHCLVNMIPEPGNWNYTHHQAHKNGWMFGIPLQSRQGWGYLYNDTITTKEEATEDIADIFNTTVDKLKLREFAFKNYYAKEFINGRIIKNGNRALFFEPLEALSGYFYEAVVIEAARVIMGEATAEQANAELTLSAQRYENFICYVYHGGSVFDSPFWQITKEKTTKHLQDSTVWQDQIRTIQMLVSHGVHDERIVIGGVSIALWNHLDNKRKYGYFK